MSPVTTHVLDVAVGRPAAGVALVLEAQTADGWLKIAKAVTDADGRARDLISDGSPFGCGRYRLTFQTGNYWTERGVRAFYPEVTIVFEVSDVKEHYHVPLLVSPFGYSTYRGS
jgi:5-hydroxyisourate hydrolase